MTKHRIMIVDDEEAVRNSLSSVLATYGYEISSHDSSRNALNDLEKSRPDCIVLDVRMPEIDGLKMLQLLKKMDGAPPVIIITGHADVQMAVQAMKSGAADFLEKPVVDEDLAASISAAIAASTPTAEESSLVQGVTERYASLTPRERDVAGMVVQGYSSSAIALELCISVRTVDHHRAAILAKMQATSLPQLLRLLLLLPGHGASPLPR
jgi:two-component system, LuxR family, response regulator FixJ